MRDLLRRSRPRRALAALPVALSVALLPAGPARACSAFLREGPEGPVVAKGYDWHDERGMVVANKRGVAKRTMALSPRDTPAAWTSRFASLSFNQYGRELPDGGMNEAGLVVEVLVLKETQTEPPDARPVATELGLVQYLLDQAATVDEAVALARKVRVVTAYAPLHYFVCDAGGACAVLELLRGKLVVTSGGDLAVRALTNTPYAAAVRDGRPSAASGNGSLARFARIAGAVRAPGAGAPVPEALAVLDTVRYPDFTQWNIVYEPAARRLHFRTRTHPALKTVRLDAFAPGCDAPVTVLDLATDTEGDVSGRFVPYHAADNRALVEATLAPLRGALPPGIAARIAALPGETSCAR